MANIGFIQKKQKSNSMGIIILLILSFFWTSIFYAANSVVDLRFLSYGNLLDSNSQAFQIFILNLFAGAIVDWLSFEIIFYFYRVFLSFKIYSFVVPKQNFKNECRIFIIYRNLIYGVFTNLCFTLPYLYIFSGLVNLIITMTVMIVFASYLNKKYSESIISHFVFKCFCFPVFLYEAITLLISIMGVL